MRTLWRQDEDKGMTGSREKNEEESVRYSWEDREAIYRIKISAEMIWIMLE